MRQLVAITLLFVGGCAASPPPRLPPLRDSASAGEVIVIRDDQKIRPNLEMIWFLDRETVFFDARPLVHLANCEYLRFPVNAGAHYLGTDETPALAVDVAVGETVTVIFRRDTYASSLRFAAADERETLMKRCQRVVP